MFREHGNLFVKYIFVPVYYLKLGEYSIFSSFIERTCICQFRRCLLDRLRLCAEMPRGPFIQECFVDLLSDTNGPSSSTLLHSYSKVFFFMRIVSFLNGLVDVRFI